MLMQHHVASNMHAAKGHGLGDSPLHYPARGVTEKPSAALQKVVVALSFRELASTCTLPLMRVSSGEAPSPNTSV